MKQCKIRCTYQGKKSKDFVNVLNKGKKIDHIWWTERFRGVFHIYI